MSDQEGLLLEVRDLTKSFPGVLALKGVSLTLAKGEVLSLIGENGAGKSTLMKILAGVQPADSGEYLIDGSPMALKECSRSHGSRYCPDSSGAQLSLKS
jgi:ABC-type sugar transport system ATPase subunit